MGNVLSKEKREQVIALGRLGWSLRRIEQATGVRRETAGDYLRSAGIACPSMGRFKRKLVYGVILALAKLTGNPTLFVHARVAQADGAIVGQHGEMPPVH
jgi:hypothetical protein